MPPEVIHLTGLDLILFESASGAPAVISPYNPDDERLIHDDDLEVFYCH